MTAKRKAPVSAFKPGNTDTASPPAVTVKHLQAHHGKTTITALTSKQEVFAQAIVSGKTQADAYRKAFSAGKMKGATIHKRASELMSDGEVAGRVAELRAPAIAQLQMETLYGLRQAMAESEEALELCRKKENGAAFRAVVALRAKLNGLLVEKREDLTDPFKKAIGNMSAEKAQQMFDAMEQMQAIQAKAKNA